jgi:hypothetical protein
MAMTEADWLNCASATQPVFRWLNRVRKRSDRKFFLAAAAAVRHIVGWLEDPRSLAAIEVLERFADGDATVNEREAAYRAALEVGFGADSPLREAADAPTQIPDETWKRTHAAMAASYAIATNMPGHKAWYNAYNAMYYALMTEKRGTMNPWQAELLREIFGNPFRPTGFDARWRTSAVTNLAQSAYAERVLPHGRLHEERLSVLADALEEAGCNEAELLAHLRRPGEHFRGCWALDLVLGKSNHPITSPARS